jgi:hypothetical protein
MRNVIVATDTDGYTDGWTEAVAQVRTPEKAQEVLTYYAFNPPSDPFDVGVIDAVSSAFGH